MHDCQLIQQCERSDWPQAECPITHRQFHPAFLVVVGGAEWCVSTEADSQGRVAGSVGFNPAQYPQWILVRTSKTAGETAAS